MHINEEAQYIHKWAVDKGWWSPAKTFGELIALCHSELSEALEHFRDRHEPKEVFFLEDGKPDGVPIELADCLIRIMDMAQYYDIDLEWAIRIKMQYNETRPHRHGGKLL